MHRSYATSYGVVKLGTLTNATRIVWVIKRLLALEVSVEFVGQNIPTRRGVDGNGRQGQNLVNPLVCLWSSPEVKDAIYKRNVRWNWGNYTNRRFSCGIVLLLSNTDLFLLTCKWMYCLLIHNRKPFIFYQVPEVAHQSFRFGDLCRAGYDAEEMVHVINDVCV